MSTDFVENDRLRFPQIAPPEFGNDPQNVPVSRRPLAIFCEIRSKTEPVFHPCKAAANAPQHPCGSAAENASQSSCASHIKSTRPASQSSCARRRRKKFKSVFFQDMRLEKDTAHEISADNFEEIEAEISCSPSQNGPAVLKQKNTRGKGEAFSPSKRQLRCAACSMGRE